MPHALTYHSAFFAVSKALQGRALLGGLADEASPRDSGLRWCEHCFLSRSSDSGNIFNYHCGLCVQNRETADPFVHNYKIQPSGDKAFCAFGTYIQIGLE
jgi:hypothetical protein